MSASTGLEDPQNPLPRVKPWVALLVFVNLCAIGLAVGFAVEWWDAAAEADPKGRRNLEAVKASLQLLTVGAFGVIVSALAAAIEYTRQKRATEEQNRADRLAAAEKTRAEKFELHNRLLERSTRCAHAMYITCQHVTREIDHAKALGSRGPKGLARLQKERAARALLDERYMKFATEALAVQTEIGARFKKSLLPQSKEYPDTVTPDEQWWRWHQIYDLLTVYYFSLTRDFPGDALITNSREEKQFHSGLDLKKVFGEKPPYNHTGGEKEIRSNYERVISDFAESLLTPDPTAPRSAGVMGESK